MLKKLKITLNNLCLKAEDYLARQWEPELRKVVDEFNARPIRNYYQAREYMENRLRTARNLQSLRLTRWISRNLQEVEERWEELAQNVERKFNRPV